MNSFISNVVNDVFSKHKNYKHLTFVLPGQRACIFLKEELIKKMPAASLMPEIITVENYIQQVADIQLIDHTQLLFEFYSLYKKNLPKSLHEPFEIFSQWASIALNDFNEIDSYLVNSEAIFANLRDIKRLNKWFQNKKPSRLAENYLQFFEYLHILYNALYEKLKNNKFGYQGLIYREATANLEYYVPSNKHKHFVFVGFNALNKAEEHIIQELLNSEIASIYWDANESFFDLSNEAGVFLRKYKQEWSYFKKHPFLWIGETETPKIEIAGVPKNVTQVKYAGELLSKMQNFDKTALILADENLLPLAMNSLPENVKNINITMGYALKDIPVAVLFDKLFKLYLNQQKFNKTNLDRFYYKDVLNLLSDPFLNKIQTKILQKAIKNIKSENHIFLSVEDITASLSTADIQSISLIISLFEISEDINVAIKQCSKLIEVLKDDVNGVEKEYLYRFYLVFQQLETLNTTYGHIENFKTLALFYNQILRYEKLSFQGEPLKGLQLMGMLETRVLDFDSVIITSVNEGILPGGKKEASFIPFDVKKYFGLPTYQEKDAIFSYHFQRLLHRTKEIFLIYNTETDGYGSGEKSRFLTQLEIVRSNDISKKKISPKVQHTNYPLLQIEKTPEVLQKLKQVFSKGISPSALATYIYDPIHFYEQKVLGIKEQQEVEETIAANTAGSVIHDVLEALYSPYIGKKISKENIAAMQKESVELLHRFFRKHYKKGDIRKGKNKLIFEVFKNYIQRFLQGELQWINQGKELIIKFLEKKLQCIITIDGIDFPIVLSGIADRIDLLDGVVRVMDYKTGKVEAKDLKLPDFSVISEDYKYTKALQVMLYSYMYSAEFKSGTKAMESGVISFKNLNAGFIKVNFSNSRTPDNEITDERLKSFEQEIKRLISEILNPDIPFTQNLNLPF